MKIYLGGLPFHIKTRWEEVTFNEAQELAKTKPNQVRERINALLTPRLPNSVKVNQGHLFALYEIVSFITEMPELVPDRIKVPPINDWTFKEFEFIRQAITQHPDELALSFPRICEVLDLSKAHYLEVGAKALDMVNEFTERWAQWGIFDASEPTGEEVAAGIERLQAFGVYAMLDRIAEKYGKTPEEIEEWKVNRVFLSWTYILEKSEFEANLQKSKSFVS